MKITFDTEKKYITKPEESKKVKSLTISQIMDNNKNKTITAFTLELGMIILWSGKDYDNIGQWTDTDVENRINELLNNNNEQ
jgi:hypothetical protein